MQVFPATFPVAPVSVIIPFVCPSEISARCLWQWEFLLLCIFDDVQMAADDRQTDSGRMLANIFKP